MILMLALGVWAAEPAPTGPGWVDAATVVPGLQVARN